MHAGSGLFGLVEDAEPRRIGHGRPLIRCVMVVASLMVSSVPMVTVLAPAGAEVHSARRWHGSVVRPGHVRSARLSALASTTGGVSSAAAQSGETELAGLRTQDSRTFAEADGTRRLVASATPMNYQDASGVWQPIDDTLIADPAAGFAWRSTADSYTAEFPADLADGPIRVSVAGQWVAFQLEGAKSTGQVSGNTITYPDAEPGVTLSYTASPTGLKETLTVANAAAASSFVFDVTTSSGVSATAGGSGVSYLSGSKAVLAMVRPWAVDAGGDDQSAFQNVSLTWASTGAHAGTATVTLRPSWLSDSATQFPITIDPTLSPTGTQITDCHLSSGGPNNNLCAQTSVKVGEASSDTRRTLMQFDVSSIPGDAVVLDADARLYLNSLTGGTSLPIQAIQNCTAWTSAATWNTPNGTASWSGGDACHSPLWTTTVSSTNSWYDWHITPLVQTWVNQGPAADHSNDGFMLERSDNTLALAAFNSSQAASNTPTIQVYYTAGVGAENSATYLPFHLTGHAEAGVNPATGNLMLTTQDFNVHGTGVGYQLNHVYNSRLAAQQYAAGADTYPGEGLSAGWTTSVGDDVFLRVYGNPAGSMAMRMPDGGWIRFTRTGNAWSVDQTASPGVNATLSVNAGGAGTHKVTFHDTGLSYWFTESGSGTIRDALLQKIVDKHGNTITINRSGGTSGAITGVTDTQNRTYSYTHTSGTLSKVSDVTGGRSVAFAPDAGGRLGTFTDANGGAYSYSYDPTSHLLTQITTPAGRTISFDYDSAGRISAIHRSTASAASNGDSCTPGTTDTWTFSYPAPDGSAPSGAVGETTVTDPTNAVTKYYDDAQRRIIRVIDPQGRKRNTSFDPNSGMATGYTDNLNDVFSLVYNNRNLTQITGPAETGGQKALSVQYSYSGSYGDQTQPSSYTDPQGNTTTYGQDTATGDITSTTNATDGSQLQLHYNTDGTVATVTDPGGLVTHYSYDDATVNSGHNTGDLKTIQPPGTQGSQQFGYDPDSRLTSATDGAGRSTSYTYDNLDRITKVTYGDGSYVSYTYDADDNVISRRDTSGRTTTIDFDGFNRPVTVHESWRSPALTDSYCYDANSRLTQLTDAGGPVKYAYNNAGDLTAVTEPGGSNCTSYTWTGTLPPASSRCIIFHYDQAARRDGTAYPGGVKQAITYFNDGQINEINTTQGGSTLDDLQYTYAATVAGVANTQTSLRQSVKDTTRGVTTNYSYDTENRLTGATMVETSPTATADYTYSYGSRNRTSQTAAGTTTQYSYSEDNELCRSQTGTMALSGCTLATGETDYKYDGAGNLTDTGTNGLGTGQFTASYNPAGQTASMTDLTGANPTTMAYNDTGQNLRTQAGTTAFTNTILGLATSTDSGGTLTSYTRDPQGTLLSYRVGNDPDETSNHYYLLDSIGTVIGTTDDDGPRDASYYYDPFGLGTSQTGTAAATNPMRFDGGYLDSTGWYHFGQRYYNPAIGRWSQADPMAGNIAAPKNVNRYIFSGDDPINGTDLSGQGWFDFASGLSDIASIGSYLANGDYADAYYASVGVLSGLAVGTACTVVFGAETGEVGCVLLGTYTAGAVANYYRTNQLLP